MASSMRPRLRRRLAQLSAAASLLIAATSALAADQPAASPSASPPTVREVIVPGTAPTLERQRLLEHFLTRVPQLNNGLALARWVDPVCPAVVGMTPEQAEYVIARLFQIARAAGAPVIDSGDCQVNVFIIATAAPDAMVKAIGQRQPHFFTNADPALMRAFLDSQRPVRAWYNARLDAESTDPMSPFEGLEGLPANIRVIHHADPTHLHTNSPYALTSAIVVVDSAHVAGMKVGALADYLAMAALTQLRPDSDSSGAPSILALFSPQEGEAPPDGLTEWDTAYLHALYHTNLEDFHQGSAIALQMNRALAHKDEDAGH